MKDIGVRRWRSCPTGPDRTLSLAVVKPVAKSQLVKGVVAWARVPFEEIDADKVRPVVIKSFDGTHVTVLPATSAASRHRFPDRYVELRDLIDAGLSRPTGVRKGREVLIDLIDVLGIVGQLSENDIHALLGTVPPDLRLRAAA